MGTGGVLPAEYSHARAYTHVHIHGVACCLVHWTLLDENCSKLRSLRSRISTLLMANSSKKTLSKNLVQMKVSA